MKDVLLKLIGESFPLTKKDHGSLGKFKVKGMKFNTAGYEAEGLGPVSVMEAVGFFGLMRMTTVIVNPFYVDAPLISYDRIKAMGNDTIYLEVFDTMLSDSFDGSGMQEVEKEYRPLPDHDLGEHWYDYMRVGHPICKKGKKDLSESFDRMTGEYFSAYLDACRKASPCDEDEKRKKAAVYSEGLLEKGGPATDPVKAELGDEAAARFFREVLFATEKT